jgi:hypothetical protein
MLTSRRRLFHTLHFHAANPAVPNHFSELRTVVIEHHPFLRLPVVEIRDVGRLINDGHVPPRLDDSPDVSRLAEPIHLDEVILPGTDVVVAVDRRIETRAGVRFGRQRRPADVTIAAPP